MNTEVWLPEGYQEDGPEERLDSKQRYFKYQLKDQPQTWLIIYYTAVPKPPETITGTVADLLNKVVEITRTRAKFVVHELGKPMGDFS